MAGNPYYTQAMVRSVDSPNIFSSIVESYLGYRVPTAELVLRARINALADGQQRKAALLAAAAGVDDERTKLLELAQKVVSSKLQQRGQRQMALSGIPGAAATATSAEYGYAKDVTTANINANKDLLVKDMDLQGKAIEAGKVRGTDKFDTAMTTAERAVGQLEESLALAADPAAQAKALRAFSDSMQALNKDIGRTWTNSNEAGVVGEEVRKLLAGRRLDNRAEDAYNIVDATMPTGRSIKSDPVPRVGGSPTFRPRNTQGFLGDLAAGISGEEGTTLQDIAGGFSAGQFVKTIDQEQEDPYADPLLKTIMNELEGLPAKKEALERAASEVDPFGGLGGFYEPLGGWGGGGQRAPKVSSPRSAPSSTRSGPQPKKRKLPEVEVEEGGWEVSAPPPPPTMTERLNVAVTGESDPFDNAKKRKKRNISNEIGGAQ